MRSDLRDEISEMRSPRSDLRDQISEMRSPTPRRPASQPSSHVRTTREVLLLASPPLGLSHELLLAQAVCELIGAPAPPALAPLLGCPPDEVEHALLYASRSRLTYDPGEVDL